MRAILTRIVVTKKTVGLCARCCARRGGAAGGVRASAKSDWLNSR